ncbi:uncharacterized protein LOC130749644 [Lotus japonicus]|uniref:uncharacterized protein LOC130749644 n=1 Tax=Lotus japonicus TaxID=34305 RepID=UPI00258E1B6E|nr:uncharacterized protein LOC130749644 [Lotus japonicus]
MHMDLSGKESGDERMGTVLEANNGVDVVVPVKAEKPEAAAATDCSVPVTPEAVRENGDLHSPLTLTVVRNQLKRACIDPDRGNAGRDGGSPRTPKDGVFDPFAPGPDSMQNAPQCKKYAEEFRNSVARRLSFIPCFVDDDGGDVLHQKRTSLLPDAGPLSDEEMVESVYWNLLRVIVSMQRTEGVLAQVSSVEGRDSDDGGCKTPPSPFRFTGIADTCPGAPMKPAAMPRNIEVGLCKKLEF